MTSIARRFGVLAPNFCRIFSQTPPPLVQNRFGRIWQQRFCSAKPDPKKDIVTIKFVKADGGEFKADAKVGENLLDVLIENDIELDGFGACEGTLACSTCHLIFKEADYKNIPEKPTDEELDMLDLAYALTDTSRLGCQVIVTKAMEGWEVHVPQGVADAREP